MNKILKLVFLFIFLAFSHKVDAQRVGYVDSKYLLENNAEYIESKKYLKAELEKWNVQLDSLNNDFNKEYNYFLNEKILLTSEQIKKEEVDLEEKKKKIGEFEKKKFGPDGELIKSQLTIINPIQNKIWTAIQTISKRRGLTIVLDKASESGMLLIYSDPRYDLTPTVLDYMNDPDKKKKKPIVIKPSKKEKVESKKIVKEEDFDINDDKNDLVESDSLQVQKNNIQLLDSIKAKANEEIKLKEVKKPKEKKIKTLSEKIKEIEKKQIIK